MMRCIEPMDPECRVSLHLPRQRGYSTVLQTPYPIVYLLRDCIEPLEPRCRDFFHLLHQRRRHSTAFHTPYSIIYLLRGYIEPLKPACRVSFHLLHQGGTQHWPSHSLTHSLPSEGLHWAPEVSVQGFLPSPAPGGTQHCPFNFLTYCKYCIVYLLKGCIEPLESACRVSFRLLHQGGHSTVSHTPQHPSDHHRRFS